ncbi:hypothetical protein CEE77_10970, partial [Lactobacillus crispatus]|uniref:hypothetical protein n=1 Tax=Lactobacillus crispatus TaxID=47770 RepID=UPI0010EA95D7
HGQEIARRGKSHQCGEETQAYDVEYHGIPNTNGIQLSPGCRTIRPSGEQSSNKRGSPHAHDAACEHRQSHHQGKAYDLRGFDAVAGLLREAGIVSRDVWIALVRHVATRSQSPTGDAVMRRITKGSGMPEPLVILRMTASPVGLWLRVATCRTSAIQTSRDTIPASRNKPATASKPRKS